MELATVTERLRLIKDAHRRFLGLWAMECLLERNTRRLVAALAEVPDAAEAADGPLDRGAALDD